MAPVLRGTLHQHRGQRHVLQTAGEKHVREMARPDTGRICFHHQRAPLRHGQQKAARCGRISDSLSRIGVAAVVWQLPAFLKKNFGRLEQFLEDLQHWKSARHAIEFRHKSWFDEEVAERLKRHAVAVCMSDAPDWPMWDRVTTDLVYIRLHGHIRKYASNYSRPALKKWATRIRRWLQENRTVHVYFDNDAEGAAPRNALTLLEMLR
jgi:uncharacterized protein YecE (DUF72 family)